MRKRWQGWEGTFLLYLVIFSSYIQAATYKEITFKPAQSEFRVENLLERSSSNSVKIKFKVDEKEEHDSKPTLSFYRYDANADNYTHIKHTDFSPSEAVTGKFNPMTPLLLENGQKIDISKKIPIIKCLVFKRKEPLIVLYHDRKKSGQKSIKLSIKTKKDREIIRLKHSDEDKSLFIGYINTSTKKYKKCDGKLYVQKGTTIKASLWHKKDEHSKNRSITSPAVVLVAYATIEGEDLAIKAQEKLEKLDIWLSLKASKKQASVGEFIQYTCTIENRSKIDIKQANVLNTLSKGLRYKKNSFYHDSEKIENVQFLNTKQEVLIPLEIEAGGRKILSFVAQVNIDANRKLLSKSLVAFANKQSNIAIAQTKVSHDFDTTSTIVGTIQSKEKNISFKGVRVYLDTGTYTHSDKSGKFHFDDVAIGAHVLSIDPDSIQGRFVLQECKQTPRTMGSKTSVYIDTSISHIQSVKFCVEEDKQTKALKPTLSFNIPSENQNKMPRFDTRSLEKQEKKETFLWPPEDYVPPMPSVKIAFLHKSDEKIELYLNGDKVDLLNYDGFVKSQDGKWTISKYRGVDIIDGDNIFEAKILGSNKSIRRNIHLSTSPVKVKFLPEKSSLLADGKTNPVIAIQLFDTAGYPLRKGMVGSFTIEKPYISQERLTYLKENPLTHNNGEDKYIVQEDGIAFIQLHETTTSGEVKLHFPFQNPNNYTKVWLNSAPREWFVVGFAKGSVGYETLKTQLMTNKQKSLKTDGQISLFAKGTVGTDALLSIAYDSGKEPDLGIIEEINPNSKYTIYADESTQKNEAPSSKKLYIKIERKTFYALFGDFDTGLDTHELSRYSRRVHGIKSEFQGEVFSYSAFVSQNKTSFQREELRGDGTSGLYRLQTAPIMIGTEKVSIEVRDRYRDEVILSQKNLTGILDYNIDYFAGTLYFKAPILSRDIAGNPQFIVVTYEDNTNKQKRISYGGRGAIKGFDGKVELGLSMLGEEHESWDTLQSIDARVELSENFRIDAAYAQTKKAKDTNNSSAKAYLLELAYHDKYLDSKLYYKKQEERFGFGQQSRAQSGTQKYGVDSTINYWQNIAIKLAMYGDTLLKTGETKNIAQATINYDKQGTSASFGARYAKEAYKASHTQLLLAFSKRVLHNKVKLSAAYEHTLGEKSDTFLNRTFAQVSYFANQYVELFVNHEILQGKTIISNQSRAGVRGRPWKGGSIESSITNKQENDALRLFGLLGINQNWKVTKELAVNTSVEREHTFQSKEKKEDFTSYAVSANYQKKRWNYNAKAEYKIAKNEEKINLDLGVYTQLNKDLGMAVGVRTNVLKSQEISSQKTQAQLSFAYRGDEDFLMMNRLAYLQEKFDNTKASKIIESFMCVLHPSEKSTISAHYGLKYVLDTIDNVHYASWIDTVGVEYLYDVSERLEVGLQGGLLHAYDTASLQKSFGASMGYSFFKNTYMGLGYNVAGFQDEDFSQLQNSQEGAYVKFRVKFDQEGLEEALKFL